MTARLHAGALVWCACEDTSGTVVLAQVRADTVVDLGCGCQRLGARRPEAHIGLLPAQRLSLLTGCAMHRSDVLTVDDLREAYERGSSIQSLAELDARAKELAHN